MKKIITILALAVGLALPTAALTAAPADADTPGCVSRSEFLQAHKGMGKARIHRIFDTDGRRDAISHGGGYTFEIRSYRSCTRYGAVSLGFTNGKMDSKFAVW